MLASPTEPSTRSRPGVAPLLGRCEPIAGESLMSLIARTCVVSGFRNLSTVLGSISVKSRPPFVPFTRLGAADEISALLRVDPVEVTARMHSGTRDTVDWFGTPLKRSFIEATERRYSAESLRQSDVLIGKALAAGVIGGEVGNQRHRIRLDDLRDFSRRYTFSNEIAERLGCSSRAAGKQLEAAGLQPAHMVYRMALWDRWEAEQAVGLKPLWQHQIIQAAGPSSIQSA